jgi:hypothetical protein
LKNRQKRPRSPLQPFSAYLSLKSKSSGPRNQILDMVLAIPYNARVFKREDSPQATDDQGFDNVNETGIHDYSKEF